MFFIKKERGFIMSSIDSAIDLNAGSVSENVKTTLRGELVLAFAVIINSLGVVLMLYSGTGISAISSVPYAFSEVFPKITLGTFTYIPGTSCTQPYDSTKEVRTIISVFIRCRIHIW